WEENVQVRILRRGENKSCICFEGKNFKLSCTVDYKGKGKAAFEARFTGEEKRNMTVSKEIKVREPKN
ncbi:hypothetical protein, partial [Klebsiella pneumoniae]|uniref:hypothetical protein n=1 Tax=Klebsiella pneumoniae TaxID=573 RepID=UPI0025A01229